MHSRDFIGGSYMVGQPATENFDRHEPWTISVASWQANHSVTRLAEYVGANETKFPCWERSPSPKQHICRFAQKIHKVEVYENIFLAMQAIRSCLHEEVGNLHPYTSQLRGLFGASTEEGRDITMQSYLEHTRRRICNAVNVNFLADIATQTKATTLAANRFEKYSPQYLQYIWASSLSKIATKP